MRYALTGPASITLKVTPPRGRAVTVARATGKAGLNAIAWNRKLGARRAAKGTYKLAVIATANGRTATSTINARLR